MSNIENTLVGMNLTYYSIAGQPLNYTIGAGDIQSVEKAEYNGQAAWKVRVGQGMQWDLTMTRAAKRYSTRNNYSLPDLMPSGGMNGLFAIGTCLHALAAQVQFIFHKSITVCLLRPGRS